jgi:hypothetical protein
MLRSCIGRALHGRWQVVGLSSPSFDRFVTILRGPCHGAPARYPLLL